MNQDETIALFLQGKDAWNAWAEAMLAEREAMEADGRWAAEHDAGDLEPQNDATRDWMARASANFSVARFVTRAVADAEKAKGRDKEQNTLDMPRVKLIIAEKHIIGFQGWIFPWKVGFDKAQFHGRAEFDGAQFHGGGRFSEAQFHSGTGFRAVRFHGWTGFSEAQFHGDAWFDEAQFHGKAWFDATQFYGWAGFGTAQFHYEAWFCAAQFHQEAKFASSLSDLTAASVAR